MNIEKIKMDHFENFEELIKTCKMWIEEDDIDAYYRFFEFNCMKVLVTAYEKEKEKNKKYEEIICRVRNLSSGVVSYDIVNGKKYLGPRKNFSKQRLYEQFLNIKEILKANYIFLSNEEFLKELEKE